MRVAITGFGAVTPVGGDAASTWAALLDGRSGVTELDEPWAEQLPVRLAATVGAEALAGLTVREQRRMDRVEQFAILAGREAWRHAGSPEADRDRVAVVIGSAIGGLTSMLEQSARLRDAGPRRVSPHTVTMMMGNGAAAWLSMAVGARAGARAPVSACASGSEAILMARQMILAGDADLVLAGGAEACVTDLTLAALAQTGALSTRNDDPTAASRPFAVGRDGFVLGEGAGVLVLEREDHARARGVPIHAFLEGAALTSDAFDIVAADPENQARTMSLALRSAGLAPDDIAFVHAHATSTPLGDANESRAIAAALGRTTVTSTKSMVGHLLGASGALGAMVAAQALRDGRVPGTINADELDPEIEVDVIRSTREGDFPAALVNAFGFGGHNVSLVLTRA
ncbi:beta-ketoacyl-[acyl-carrier-protein] synthase family protein [Agromyces bauzanensis]|uniref:3-oxoacyl-ACP synthase n=1 Tax=Agromyces bauzanensis TaxID=1308924 RepID=A0A917UM56_9MICO|nr:beta-ketoacyl-[acyl-carrier-protein] synthase family protein [Agromyces bauzanensis]GGJ67518.1 3-oxoacyl-ACP synthase [Agromyces bauzanensis]